MKEHELRDLVNRLRSWQEDAVSKLPDMFQAGLAFAYQNCIDELGMSAEHLSSDHKFDRGKVWTKQEGEELLTYVEDMSKDSTWGGVSMEDRIIIAKRIGRTVNGCRDQWRKLKGLRS